jgi:hypothetical protein
MERGREASAHAVVTPELKAKMIRIEFFHIGDLILVLAEGMRLKPGKYQFRGSFGLSDGCG